MTSPAYKQLRMFECRPVVLKEAFSGSEEEIISIVSGARLVVTLRVEDVDPGAVLTLNILNSFDVDGTWDNLATLTVNTVTTVKRVFSDFNALFKFQYSTTGGSVKFKVAIAVFDNAISTKIENATVDVNLNHTLDSEGRFDSVRIGDGVDLLAINPDGSLNINVIPPLDESVVTLFNEISNIAGGSEEDLISYTVPMGVIAYLNKIDVSGDNIAVYEVYIDTDLMDKKRTNFGGDLGAVFEFADGTGGLRLEEGTEVLVKVTHNRPYSSDFNGRIQVVEKG